MSTSSNYLKPRPRTVPQAYLLQMHYLLPRKTAHVSQSHSLLAFHLLQGQQSLLQDLGQNHTAQLRKKKKKTNESKMLKIFISIYLLINIYIKEAKHTDILFQPLLELKFTAIILFPRTSDWAAEKVVRLSASLSP